jgi:hypothetical protein
LVGAVTMAARGGIIEEVRHSLDGHRIALA